jgi:hypothetical protein
MAQHATSWIASSLPLLAMTADARAHSHGANAPESCKNFFALRKQRAQGKPGAQLHPQPRMQSLEMHTSIVTTGSPKRSGLPCAMVLTAASCSPRRPGSFATVACRRLPANLTPASGRQDHTTLPSAISCARLAPPPRPPHLAPNVRDDRDTPLSEGTRQRGT